eukprot:m.9637 g.9637  ORF g.9637 m.9637 type:complete len:256 (-) comp6973_c0_seq1:530-1297(-)
MWKVSPPMAAMVLFVLLAPITMMTSGAAPTRVTCVGDSITIYACASNNTMPYPQQLGRILGPDYLVANLGNSGKTMLKKGLCGDGGAGVIPVPPCSGDCAYWDQKTYADAMASQPDIVTIMLGTNDAKGCNFLGAPDGTPVGQGTEFEADYIDMISKFKALPTKPKVYVVLPPPLTHPPRNQSWPPPYNMSLHVINNIYPVLQRTVASKAGADGVIDVWTALGGTGMNPDMTCDGCHPKDAALTIIAKTIAATIA